MSGERIIRISEEEVNPEDVYGNDFRFLQIIGKGSGRGFDINGLSLPKGWEDQLAGIKPIEPVRIASFFATVCEKWGHSLESLVFDKNNILKEITVKGNNAVSSLFLSDLLPSQTRGSYLTNNVQAIDTAFVLQFLGARYLSFFDWAELGPSYIDGSKDSGFDSRNLKIPEKFIQQGEILTNPSFQNSFTIEASNIAGRFGLTLRSLGFDDMGLLDKIIVNEGNCCCFNLDQEDTHNYFYYAHNVDTLEQAFAFHTITASFINYFLSLDNPSFINRKSSLSV